MHDETGGSGQQGTRRGTGETRAMMVFALKGI